MFVFKDNVLDKKFRAQVTRTGSYSQDGGLSETLPSVWCSSTSVNVYDTICLGYRDTDMAAKDSEEWPLLSAQLQKREAYNQVKRGLLTSFHCIHCQGLSNSSLNQEWLITEMPA